MTLKKDRRDGRHETSGHGKGAGTLLDVDGETIRQCPMCLVASSNVAQARHEVGPRASTTTVLRRCSINPLKSLHTHEVPQRTVHHLQKTILSLRHFTILIINSVG